VKDGGTGAAKLEGDRGKTVPNGDGHLAVGNGGMSLERTDLEDEEAHFLVGFESGLFVGG